MFCVKNYAPINHLTAEWALRALIDFTLSNQTILLVNGELLGRERVNNVKNYVPINPLTANFSKAR